MDPTGQDPAIPPAWNPPPAWNTGGGESGELVRSIDWSQTPLGAIESWPQSLSTIVGTLLHCRHPMFLWWGPELIQIYNDAYVPSFGKGKHPKAMGQRGANCWQEIWPIIGPQIEDVMRHGKASWHEDHLVPVWRNERIEEVYWTYGYSPVFCETRAVGGTLVVCTETTERVLAERRLRAMRSLAKGTASATTLDSAVAAASQVLAETTSDTPFALIYLNDDAGPPALCRPSGLATAEWLAVDRACRTKLSSAPNGALLDLGLDIVGMPLPGGPWAEASTSAFVAPIRASEGSPVSGFIVFGLSPHLPFDETYRGHLTQLAEHLGLALARIQTYQAREATATERDNLLLKAPMATALFRGPEHVFELANAIYCRMVGRFDLVGKTYREAFPELVDTALPGILDRVYRTGEPFSSGELLVRLDKNGDGTLDTCFFQFNLEALRDRKGQVYGMMAVAIEITEQVNARHAIERSQEEREELLRDLEAANRSKDEFLAMLGHELRNPLSPIVTALHLMRQADDGRTVRERAIIERQVGHLVRLVDDLLDISKITRGKVALRKEPLEIADVVNKAVEMASDLLEERRHRLSIEVPHGLVVEGDAVRLAQVFANLLTNAARYTDAGGRVVVRAFHDGADVVITVKDDGMGLSPSLLPRVFDLFVQGSRSADRKEGGLGLGLAIVKSLTGLHGGSVLARSDGDNLGSEFEIRLPAMTNAGATVESVRSPLRRTRGTTQRVLVVDDNVDSVEMLRELLQSAGHEVLVAYDGPSALEVAEQGSPDVALLDIGLPVMDGYQLGLRLRETVRGGSCRLIALSGYGQEHDRIRSHASGFEAHMVKPVDPDRLLRIIAEPDDTRATGS